MLRHTKDTKNNQYYVPISLALLGTGLRSRAVNFQASLLISKTLLASARIAPMGNAHANMVMKPNCTTEMHASIR